MVLGEGVAVLFTGHFDRVVIDGSVFDVELFAREKSWICEMEFWL